MPFPMPVTDSMFLIAEGRSQPMHVGSLQIFDPPADGLDLAALYDRMLAETTLAPLYRKRAVRGVTTGGQWAWSIEDEVELEHHVRRSALPRPGRPRELLELVSRLHAGLLDPRRPLWEAHLIEGLWDGKFAIYTKVHHSVMDGVTGLKLLVRSLSADPDERDMPAPWSRAALLPPGRAESDEPDGPLSAALATALGLPAQALSAVGGVKDALLDAAGLAPALAKVVAKGLTDSAQQLPFDAPRTILNDDNISSSRRFAAQSWQLHRIRAVARAGGYTVNDVMLAMCSGALRSWLDGLGALPESSLVSMVPVSLQSTGDSGNSVGTILCNLGTDLATAGARIERVHDSMTKGKAALEGLSPMQVLALSLPGMAPFALRRTLPGPLQRPPFNLVISNVPGPSKPLYFDGARLEQLYPLSIPLNGQAMNITVVSNDDQLGFGIVGCRKRAPHLQRLLGHLDEELTALERDVA